MEKTKPFVIEYNQPKVLLGCELVDLEGNIFKSSKAVIEAHRTGNVSSNPIIYCPVCGAGNRDTAWGFPRNKRKIATHKGQCPNCGERLTISYRESVDDCPSIPNKKGEPYVRIARVSGRTPSNFAHQLKWWPVSDGKLTIETVSHLCFNRTMYGNYFIQTETLRYRFIYNLDTGMCYSMKGIDIKGQPSKYSVQEQRLQNRTFDHMSLIHYEMQQDFINIVLTAMREYKGIDFLSTVEESDISCKANIYHRIDGRTVGVGSLGCINYFAEMKRSDLLDMMNITGDLVPQSAKRVFKNLISLSKDSEVEWLPQYMQRRSIRNRLNKRAISFYMYKWLHACGLKDVNIMNRIVDDYIDNVTYRPEDYSPFSEPSADSTNMSWIVKNGCLDISSDNMKFMRWAINGRDANSIYHLVKSALHHQHHLLFDSARMYKELVDTDYELPQNVGTLKELHDELSVLNNKRRHSNLVIKYSEDEKNLEMDCGEYSFRLAKDTDSLYDIGKELSICVGSYGRDAAAKRCTIVTMSRDDKCVACIELSVKKKEMVMRQLKGRFNHTVKEIEPVTEWVAATGINAKCYDYETAVEHKSNGFDNRDRDYHVENPRFNQNVHARNWDVDFDVAFPF